MKPITVTEIDELSGEMTSLHHSYDQTVGELMMDVMHLALLMQKNEESPAPNIVCRKQNVNAIACWIQERARTLSSHAFKHCKNSNRLTKLLRVKPKKEEELAGLKGPVFFKTKMNKYPYRLKNEEKQKALSKTFKFFKLDFNEGLQKACEYEFELRTRDDEAMDITIYFDKSMMHLLREEIKKGLLPPPEKRESSQVAV